MEPVKKLWDWMSTTTMASWDGRSIEPKNDEGKKATATSAKAKNQQSSFGDNNVNNNNGPKDNDHVMNHEPIGEIPREITVVRPCHHPGLAAAGSAEDDVESGLDVLASILDKRTKSDQDHARHRKMVDSKRNGERLGHHTAKRSRR